MEERSCGMLIKRIHDALAKSANNILRLDDITLSQLMMLNVISADAEKKLTFKELERELHVAQPTVVGIVSRLEQKGLLVTDGDSADRRIKVAFITEDGEKKCQHARKLREQTETQLLMGFTEDEKDSFLRQLARVAANIDQF